MWWSVEPVIDPAQALDFIAEQVAAVGTIDHYKLGKLNGYDAETRAIEKGIDWPAYREQAREILNAAGYTEITTAGAFEVGTFFIKSELREAREGG